VVVCHRPTHRLDRCLESVLHQADEVVVVDNASPSGSAGAIARQAGAKFVRAQRDVGFAAAANQGVAATRGEIVAFLDDNAVAGEGWMVASRALLEDPTIGAVAPRVVFGGRYLEVVLDDEPSFAGAGRRLGRRLTEASLGGVDVLDSLAGPGVQPLEIGATGETWRWTTGRAPFYAPLVETDGDLELRLNGDVVRPSRVVDLLSSAGSYLRDDGHVGDIGSENPNDERLDVAEERFSLSAAALVTRRDVLKRVGGFEARYVAFYEDADWCWRARLMGFRMFYDPATTIRREQRVRSGGLGFRRVRHLAERNRILTLLRNAPLDVAVRETWRKHRGGGDDGVAEVLPKMLPRALGERELSRRRWVMQPREVFERWAGIDVPLG
jgi:GT2 family glycosyltransferase